LDIKIFGVPTLREADGLAMSSRNALLSDHQRSIAVAIYQTLVLLAKKAKQGRTPIYYLAKEGKNMLLSKGFDKVEYLEFRDAETLEEITNTIKRPTRIFVAAHLGSVRLIDNIEILP
jgi:pantoate--beta-alanine ligase